VSSPTCFASRGSGVRAPHVHQNFPECKGLTKSLISKPAFVRVGFHQVIAPQRNCFILPGAASMHRIQWIEIHEQPWFPSSLRDEITDALYFGLSLLKAYAPIAPLLQEALDFTGSQSIVDMCSGGGGPWSDLSRRIQGDGHPFRIWLTDKYPNLTASQNFTSSANHCSVYPDAVDAMNVPHELKGFRTIFTSFHHFSPVEAQVILQNAVDARQGIGVFEITRRAPFTIGLMFLWALLPFVCTPFIRPFRLSRLFWTYVVPVIPLVLLFDGVVSCLRTYRPQELQQIIEELNTTAYRWQIGEQCGGIGRLTITYSIGCPKT